MYSFTLSLTSSLDGVGGQCHAPATLPPRKTPKLMTEGRNVKFKVHPRTGHEDPEVEEMHSFTLSLTSSLEGVGGQRHAPATLPPGKTPYPLYRRLGGPQAGLDRCGKSRPHWDSIPDRPARSE
jgi:hypothetical protein